MLLMKYGAGGICYFDAELDNEFFLLSKSANYLRHFSRPLYNVMVKHRSLGESYSLIYRWR